VVQRSPYVLYGLEQRLAVRLDLRIPRAGHAFTFRFLRFFFLFHRSVFGRDGGGDIPLRTDDGS
jgi:hypothetical protein